MATIRPSTMRWVWRNRHGSIVPRIAARTAVTNTASTPNASATFADSSQPKREPMQAKPSQRMSNSAKPLRNSRATTNGMKRRARAITALDARHDAGFELPMQRFQHQHLEGHRPDEHDRAGQVQQQDQRIPGGHPRQPAPDRNASH